MARIYKVERNFPIKSDKKRLIVEMGPNLVDCQTASPTTYGNRSGLDYYHLVSDGSIPIVTGEQYSNTDDHVVLKSAPTTRGSWERAKREREIRFTNYFVKESKLLIPAINYTIDLPVQPNLYIRPAPSKSLPLKDLTDDAGFYKSGTCSHTIGFNIPSKCGSEPQKIIPYRPYGDPVNICSDLSVKVFYSYKYESFLTTSPGYKYLDSKISEARNLVKSLKLSTYSQLRNGYDILTDIAELPSSLSTVSSLVKRASNILTHVPKVLRSKKLDSKAAGQWLEYRYGIMPIVYSLKDIVDLTNKIYDPFLSKRSRRVIPLEFDSRVLPNGDPKNYDIVVGTITVNVLCKAGFNSADSRLRHQLTINPLLTAWDMVPYSLVVNWFINVSDYIVSRSSPIEGVNEKCMYSIKIEASVQSYRTPPGLIEPQAVSSYSIKEYQREIFVPSEAELTFQPNMNLARYVDAIALSINPLKSFSRQSRA